MSTSLIPNLEYIAAHPLSWSADVSQSLKLEIVDGSCTIPAPRPLGSDISVDLTLLKAVGIWFLQPKYSGFGGFLQECLTAVKTANGQPVDVSFSPGPIELKRPTDFAVLRVSHYSYRRIPFLAFVTPDEVQRARSAMGICDADTFDITSYYLAVLIALSQQAVNFLERGRDAYPARVAYPTEDGEHIIVLTALVPASFLDKFERGTDQTDSLEVFRTKITIGDGSSILEFAKEAIASALEPQKPEPPIIRGKYLRRVRRSPATQQHEGRTSVLRVG